ncbi:ankyrin repeat-containing protein [Tieghemostelium lacteum]|uniref:non-specific serine/threonine protein kinase n=1 Tax=Tieghemostelium lacteum TaxID=361077 RepID=A0A152A133_TIELA|nr:ankyrin repeat-containing protein [Tieghemostelium lacteum]|eukprot:KYQ99908.1 ankyrin repeat-containing protein [Tieghemostelium lacteum]
MSNKQDNELILAVTANDYEKVKKLKDKKKVKSAHLLSFDQMGHTPISIALKNNQENILEILLDLYKQTKTDINTKDRSGYSVLHVAAGADERLLVRVLQFETINVDVQNEDRNTPLHYFCQKYRSPNIQEPFQLFMKKNVDINAQNKNGETPLHKAIFNNSVRLMLVDMLLKNGANVNIVNSNQESPLHYAVHLGREDLVSVLLKAGANVDIIGGFKDKITPYDLAMSKGNKEMASRIKKYKDLFIWLQENGIEAYKDNFVKEEMFMDELGEINEKILDKMGITATGNRLRILKVTAPYREQFKNKTMPKKESIIFQDDDDDSSTTSTPDINGLRDSLHALKHVSDIVIIKNDDLEYTEKLGAGSSGKVYKGLYNGKEVAIKVLKSMTEAKEIEEFKKEFQIMSAIRSKYVVHFYGAVLEPKLCMVMENCSRGSLYHVMNSDKYDIGWDKTFRFAIEMVKGIECLHKWEPPIFHRDLKSLNLLVNEKWEIKVCDFGLSRFNTGSNLQTLVQMRGTFAYCGPEVYHGQQFSAKSDVYSIAMILWELVTRCINARYERPFSEFKNLQHDFQIIIQTAKKNLRPTIPPTCPPSLVELIKTCWDHEPDKRPNCSETLKRLYEIEAEYKANASLWDKAIVPLPPHSE